MSFTIASILGACIIPGIAAVVAWFLAEKSNRRILIAVGTFVLVMAICISTKYLLSSSNESSQTSKEATQNTTMAEETTTEPKPVYASFGDVRINITDTNYKRIKSYKKLNFSHQTDETNEDEEYVWKDSSDTEKKKTWNNITKMDGDNADFVLYQDRITSNIFTIHKIRTSDTTYTTIDEFLADFKSDSDVIVNDKHIDIDGVHAYTMFETYDEGNITETIFIYNGNSYLLTVRPFYLSTDLEEETNKIISKISFK